MTATGYQNSMLPVVWDYTHPVTGETVLNVEALCRKVLNRLAAGVTPPLEAADYADALCHLLGAVDLLARTKWKPDKYPNLGAWLEIALPSDLIDHWRSYRGRSGEKCVPPDRRPDPKEPYEPPDLAAADLDFFDLRALPERSRRTVRKIGVMLLDERTYTEIGAHFGRSREWVAAEVELLKADIALYWPGAVLELDRVAEIASAGDDDYYEEEAA